MYMKNIKSANNAGVESYLLQGFKAVLKNQEVI